MNKLKSLAFQYPLRFSIFIIIMFTVITENVYLEPYLTNYIGIQSASYATGILVQGLGSMIFFILIAKSGILKNAGFTKIKDWKQLWLVWPIIVLSIFVSWSLFDGTLTINTTNPLVILLFILVYVSTGFYEEILFRGLIMTIIMQKWGNHRRGIYFAVISSSILFGILHIINFFLRHVSLLAAVTQVLYATFFGVFFAACVLRCNTIWPAIILHAVFDICSNLDAIGAQSTFGQISNMNTTLTDALSSILVTLPFLIYGLFLLRKVKPYSSLQEI